MDFIDISKMRTTVRKYSDKKVEPEKLEKILEAGRWAPTAVSAAFQAFGPFEASSAENPASGHASFKKGGDLTTELNHMRGLSSDAMALGIYVRSSCWLSSCLFCPRTWENWKKKFSGASTL